MAGREYCQFTDESSYPQHGWLVLYTLGWLDMIRCYYELEWRLSSNQQQCVPLMESPAPWTGVRRLMVLLFSFLTQLGQASQGESLILFPTSRAVLLFTIEIYCIIETSRYIHKKYFFDVVILASCLQMTFQLFFDVQP